MSAPQKPAALARELADLLIDLSIALHKHAMYPADHPSLAPAAAAVIHRLERVMQEHTTLSLGVARHQLVIEGVATDPSNAVLTELASHLHRHHLGAITFRRGLTSEELGEVLELIGKEPDRSDALGLGPAERLTAWPHLRLYPLSYHHLRLADDDRATAQESERRTRAAQLWLGLAQAALGIDAGEDQKGESATADPSQVAEAIERRPRDTAYEQVIVGYLLQIAEELKRGGGEAIALRNRVSDLVRHLDPATLDRLLEMGGDHIRRRRFLLDASDTLTVEAVVNLVRAASMARHETVSHALLRMLQKLGHHAAEGAGRRAVLADQSVRDQVAELIRNWALKDPDPEAYRDALQQAASATPDERVADSARFEAEPQRMLHMALELKVRGTVVDRAVQQLLESGQLDALTSTLEAASSDAEGQAIWQQLARPDVVAAVLAAERIDPRQLDLLVSRLGMAAAEPMLDALATSRSSQARRVLLDRLVRIGSAIAPLVVRRLEDASWFVQRNMLAILAELPERPSDFDAQAFLEHTDARVRREALRLLLRDPGTRERAVHCALADPDERAMRLGLATAIEQGLPESAVPLTASLAVGAPSQDLRVSAIRALGTAPGAAAVDALLRIVTPKKRGLFRRRVARTAEVEAAVVALRRAADHPRVRATLADLDEA